MDATWFGPLVDDVLGSEPPYEDQRAALARLLAELARASGGEVVGDFPEPLARARAVAAAEDAITAYLRAAEGMGPPAEPAEPQLWARPLRAARRMSSPLVALHELVPRVSLASGTFAELEALPGLGPVTAARVVERRERVGPFHDVEELRSIPGIDADAMRELAEEVTTAVAPDRLTACEAARSTLVGLAGLVIRVERTAAAPGRAVAPSIPALTLELERALAWVRTHPFARYQRRTVESARRAGEDARHEAERQRLVARAIDDVVGAALVLDGDYLRLATELVESARSSIRLVMFFFRHEPDDDRYPTRPLLDGLVAAHAGGVDVKVLLDRDREGDAYRSQLVNRPAYEALRAAGVPVRRDAPERVTHGKLLVVDERHVLLGSHGWSAASLWIHDDTSVYVESPRLARHYIDVFGGRFEAASG